jgi:putative effector of murein hydrolase LrgA (UPF0299 family)
MPKGDLNGDGVVDSADWKLAYSRWWLYLMVAVGLILVAFVFPFWITLTIIGVVILFGALSKWALGRWVP